jgi:type III pantothenate kinase
MYFDYIGRNGSVELMIDIGNTHTVIGLFKHNALFKEWRIMSNLARTEDERWIILESFLTNASIEISEIKGVCISSVVPDQNMDYKRMIVKYLNLKPLFITHKLKLGMQIEISEPASIGADRICNAVAGKLKFGSPAIIIDFGTATTFDCINAQGNYVGGVICQGIESAAHILHLRAAKLPQIDLYFPEHVIGKNTEDSMRSGILYGSVEMISGLLNMIKNELGGHPKVIATGGLASSIAKKTVGIDAVDGNLNLEGMNYIYRLNFKGGIHEE